jgi:hypothetical protein
MADNDRLMNEHKQTWKGFVRLMTVSSIAVAITLGLMAIFLL